MKHVERARLIVWQADLLLVVAKARAPLEARYYNLPGGHVEPGESPQECAARELEEELGVGVRRVGRLWYVGDNTYTRKKRTIHETVLYFEAEPDARWPGPGPVPTREERLVARLASADELRQERCLPPLLFSRLLADGPEGPPTTTRIVEGSPEP